MKSQVGESTVAIATVSERAALLASVTDTTVFPLPQIRTVPSAFTRASPSDDTIAKSCAPGSFAVITQSVPTCIAVGVGPPANIVCVASQSAIASARA